MNKKYGLNELREMFLSFFESKEHLRLPSFSLIPQNDNSLLLINSGMAPMKPYFKGEQVPPRQRVCTCQKCIRTGDIENIGKTSRHGTFFEMLGNFSFGDYFKHEAIAWSWEFLTSSDWVGLDPNRLYPSVYVDDEEAFNIWKDEIGIAPNRIFKFGKEDNFWEHGAGPCGPCSEIYYDRGEKYGCGKQNCTVGCDCDRYIEVWNNVFSQFDNDGKNNYSELKQKNIDTGMGLERLAVVCQDVDSLFDVDTVMNITNKVSELTNAYYGKDHKTDVSLRVITDHIRSSVFMICDGILPSNEGRGYVLRRLLRRAARHGKLLGINEPFLYKIVNTVVNESKTQYPELIEKCDYIVSMVKNEEDNFAKTLDAGLAKFSDMLKVSQNGIFSGENAFRLYDTFGFPIDLTIDMCDEIGLHVDEDEFKRLMQEQKERARNARKALGDLGWAGEEFGKDVPETIFVGYNNLSSASKVVAVLNDGKSDSEINDGDSGVIVLDNTPFYATMGGQVSDIGCISTKDSIFTVTKVEKNKGGKYMHFGTLSGSQISVNDSVNCEIDLEYRRSVSRSHDATHLLQAALKTVLGDQVHQAGSLVESDALRFDFTYFKPLTLEEITEVETIVNKFILSAFEINTLEMSLEEAQRTGATALFGEKYGSVVRVVSMGDISKEFCGGTHLDNTSMIGLFKIISEGSIASGVRRITAYTGFNAINSFYENQNKLLSEIDAYNLEIKELKKTIEHYKSKETYDNAEKYLKEIKSINGFDVITKKLDNIDSNTMKNIGDALKEKNKNIILLLASVANDKITYYCCCGDTAVKNGANAGNIIKAVTSITNGKGGGKPDSAMGGGNDLSKLDQSLDVEVFING